jgi:hypothetical protein
MSDPIWLLHKSKLEEYHRKEEVLSWTEVKKEILIKELPVLEKKSFSVRNRGLATGWCGKEWGLFGDTTGGVSVIGFDGREGAVMRAGKKTNSCVTSIDVVEMAFAIVGYASGEIALFDLKGFKVAKTVNLFSAPVVKVKFGENLGEAFALTDRVHHVEIKKKLLNYSVSSTVLPIEEQAIVTFEVLKSGFLPERYVLIVSIDRFFVYSIKNKSLFFEGFTIVPGATPYISWTATEEKYTFSIGSGTRVVVFNILKEGFKASGFFTAPRDICGISFVNNEILVVLSRYSDVSVFSTSNKKC